MTTKMAQWFKAKTGQNVKSRCGNGGREWISAVASGIQRREKPVEFSLLGGGKAGPTFASDEEELTRLAREERLSQAKTKEKQRWETDHRWKQTAGRGVSQYGEAWYKRKPHEAMEDGVGMNRVEMDVMRREQALWIPVADVGESKVAEALLYKGVFVEPPAGMEPQPEEPASEMRTPPLSSPSPSPNPGSNRLNLLVPLDSKGEAFSDRSRPPSSGSQSQVASRRSSVDKRPQGPPARALKVWAEVAGVKEELNARRSAKKKRPHR